MNNKQLIVIAGPTAVGKTSFAIDLALYFNTEIISADSRQFYKEMTIGTAKPTFQELNAAKHHMIDSLSIAENYDAGKFSEEAEELLKELFLKFNKVVLVGGSGMYVKALCDGLDSIPEVADDIREELNQSWINGNKEILLRELQENDPEYYETVDHNNRQRVTRGIEVFRATGRPYSFFRKGDKKKAIKDYSVIKIGLELDREELYKRINERMDQMISDGLFKEAEKLYKHRELNALQTVGYREVFSFLDGEYDKEETIRLLKRNSRRYAKRQMTWFKRDEEFTWFRPMDRKIVINYIETLS
ncbi:MAG: tRNA dimethylallyltransferase [Cyclobacteriaceae bacterium]|jgi:tRNA dimethylallyltransferase